MKKLFLIALLALAGCTKPHDCMHMHMGGAQIEVCSANVVCLENKDENGTSKICQYIPSQPDETK